MYVVCDAMTTVGLFLKMWFLVETIKSGFKNITAGQVMR